MSVPNTAPRRWTRETDEWFVKMQMADSRQERDDIFTRHIYGPMVNMVWGVIKRRGVRSMLIEHYGKDDVTNVLVAHCFKQASNFDHTHGSRAFSYMFQVSYNEVTKLLREMTKEKAVERYFIDKNDDHGSLDGAFTVRPQFDQSLDKARRLTELQETLELIMSDVDDHIENSGHWEGEHKSEMLDALNSLRAVIRRADAMLSGRTEGDGRWRRVWSVTRMFMSSPPERRTKHLKSIKILINRFAAGHR